MMKLSWIATSAIACILALMLCGAGPLSVDSLIAPRIMDRRDFR